MKFNKWLNEINLPKKKWVETSLTSLNDDQLKELWYMYERTYSYLDLSFKDVSEMKQRYKLLGLIDIDEDPLPDAFIIYKKQAGNKISFLGSDGSKPAKHELMKHYKKLIKTDGWWIEASGKLEDISKGMGAPVITDEEMVRKFIKKDIEWVGDGYYKRKLHLVNKWITKRIYGKPK